MQTDAVSKARKELEQKRVEMNRLLESRHDMLHRLRSEQVNYFVVAPPSGPAFHSRVPFSGEQIEVPLLVDDGAASSEDESAAAKRGRARKGSKTSRTARTGAIGGEDADMDDQDNTQQSQEEIAAMRTVAKDERLFAKIDFAFVDDYMGVRSASWKN